MCYNKLFLTSICRKPAFQCIPWQRYVHCLCSSIQMDNRPHHHSVSISEYFNINKYNLFTVDKIIHRVLPWLRMLAVKLQLIEIEGTLWVEGIYFSLLIIFDWHFLYKAIKSFFYVRFSLQHFYVESSVLSLHGCVWLEQWLTCSLFKDHGNSGLLQTNHVKQKKVTFV